MTSAEDEVLELGLALQRLFQTVLSGAPEVEKQAAVEQIKGLMPRWYEAWGRRHSAWANKETP